MNFLPLGTVVRMHGATKMFMIVARALVVKYEGEQRYVDYGAITYPEGLIQDRIYYLNAESISEVIQKGYSDDDDEKLIASMREMIKRMPYKKADIKTLS